MHKHIAAALIAVLLCSLPATGLAETETITVTHTYVMGDSESKNEARANCLAEAKRKIAEQAGAYVEILSKTKNFQIDHDAVLSFTAALVRVTIDEERFDVNDQHLSITLTVTGEVDPEAVKQRMDELAERRLAAMERETPLPEAQLPELEAAPQEAEQEVKVGLTTPDNLDSKSEPRVNAPTRARNPRKAKERLARSLEETTRLCVDLTEPGMSRNEVEHLLGEPRAVKQNTRYSYTGAKYGHLWVVFRDDVVACVRSRLEYRRNAGGEAHCEGFAVNFVKR